MITDHSLIKHLYKNKLLYINDETMLEHRIFFGMYTSTHKICDWKMEIL